MTDAKTPTSTLHLGAAGRPRLPDGEARRLGREIYRRDIRDKVLADHDGELVAIDVETGEWAMGHDRTDVLSRLKEKSPDANDIWCERVGYLAVTSLGGHPLPRDNWSKE